MTAYAAVMLATASFVIDTWEEHPLGDGATKISRVRATKTFDGDLVGTSTIDFLTATTAVETSRAYVGFERFAGQVHGRAGSLVLQHTAVATADRQTLELTIVPDSGTDELAGVEGTGTITIDSAGGHTITLDYTLRPSR